MYIYVGERERERERMYVRTGRTYMYVEILGEGHPAVMNMYASKLRLKRRLEHRKRPLV